MKKISILTFNTGLFYAPYLGRRISSRFLCPVGFFEPRRRAILRYLATYDVDIMCLQEVYTLYDKKKFKKALEEKYPYSYFVEDRMTPLVIPNDLMIFSKVPITEGNFFKFDELPWMERFYHGGFQEVSFDVEGRKFTIYNTHLTIGGLPFIPNARPTRESRSQQFSQIFDRMQQRSEDTILLGDFNCGPNTSPANYNEMLEVGLLDTFAMDYDGSETQLTYDDKNYLVEGDMWFKPLPQRIDHIFIRRGSGLKISKSDVVLKNPNLYVTPQLKIPLSDHYGVQTEFEI